jgi:2-polyprenyl-3-methyl-5-hydroxy-6-metoxy-1,4-benzoquinol methylase
VLDARPVSPVAEPRRRATYLLDNAAEYAASRLALMEQTFDPGTRRRLADLVQPGWHCLEIGAGKGSIADWLSELVGPEGRVTATDVDTRFMDGLERPNLDVVHHDIAKDDLPHDGYDLIHARCVLLHMLQRDTIVKRMAEALRPGGWLVVEDLDVFSALATDDELYVGTWEAIATLAEKVGVGIAWGRSLPRRFESHGLVNVMAEADVQFFRGGSPLAYFWEITWTEIRDVIVGAGLRDGSAYDAAIARLRDPQFWAISEGLVAVHGQRPA